MTSQVITTYLSNSGDKLDILTVNISITLLFQHWTDAGLKWDPKDFDNITKITLPSQDIWKPDIVLYNM